MYSESGRIDSDTPYVVLVVVLLVGIHFCSLQRLYNCTGVSPIPRYRTLIGSHTFTVIHAAFRVLW